MPEKRLVRTTRTGEEIYEVSRESNTDEKLRQQVDEEGRLANEINRKVNELRELEKRKDREAA